MREKSDSKVIWSPRSLRDVHDLGDYLVQFVSISKVEGIVAEILMAGDSLNEFPRLSRVRNDIYPDLRLSLVHPYVICYLIENKVAHVVRVLHGKQDIAAALSENPTLPFL